MPQAESANEIHQLLEAFPEETRIRAFNYCLVMAKAEMGMVRVLGTNGSKEPTYLAYETGNGRFMVQVPDDLGPREETLKTKLVSLLQGRGKPVS